MKSWLSNWSRNRLSVKVGDTIRTGRSPMGLSVVSLEGVRMAILTASRLRNIGNDLHATRDHTSWTTAPRSIRRCSGTSEPLSELLNQGNSNIVSCNVHSISNTEDNEGTFGRQGKASVRGIQTCARGFLDLANADTTLADNGTDQNVRDKEAKRVGLGLCSRGGFKRLIVKGTDDKTKGLLGRLAGHQVTQRTGFKELTLATAS